MSLLMQALKKAERAQQNAAGGDELDKPSQAYDEILALTPEPALPPGMSAASTRQEPSLSLEPLAGLSLEPMTAQAGKTTASGADATPATPAVPAMESTLGLALEPVAPTPSTTASAAPVAAGEAATQPAHDLKIEPTTGPTTKPTIEPANAPAAANGAQASAASTAARAGNRGASQAAAAGPRAPATEATAAAATASAARPKPASARNANSDSPRARARANDANDASKGGMDGGGIDPERLRLFGLIGLLLLVIAGFGYYYWQAVMAPGAGARLPPVPMPPPGATGATPAQVVSAPTATRPADSSTSNGRSEDGMLLAAPQKATVQRDELERRLSQAEQQLAATQQALQAQLNAPQPERLPPLAAPENSEIRVARALRSEPLAAQLGSAYRALNTGELASARQQYEAVLQQDGNNRDALLALASIASREQQPAQAASYYLRLLELDPRDGAAIAGMVGLRQGDPAQNEIRLKGILANNPEAAPVHFALGNLYAQQGRWQDAQQAYFHAYSAAPSNPDYAYNLAIGLDRLNQGKLAQTYYQRALTLAQDTAAAFDRAALRKRLQELGGNAR